MEITPDELFSLVIVFVCVSIIVKNLEMLTRRSIRYYYHKKMSRLNDRIRILEDYMLEHKEEE